MLGWVKRGGKGQFLLGRLETESGTVQEYIKEMFQFLLGRLETLRRSYFPALNRVSIPLR